MSDIQPATSQAGAAQAKPKDLRALVQDMGHWRLYAVSAYETELGW